MNYMLKHEASAPCRLQASQLRQALKALGVNNSGKSLHSSQSHWDSDSFLVILTTGGPVASTDNTAEVPRVSGAQRFHPHPFTHGLETNI